MTKTTEQLHKALSRIANKSINECDFNGKRYLDHYVLRYNDSRDSLDKLNGFVDHMLRCCNHGSFKDGEELDHYNCSGYEFDMIADEILTMTEQPNSEDIITNYKSFKLMYEVVKYDGYLFNVIKSRILSGSKDFVLKHATKAYDMGLGNKETDSSGNVIKTLDCRVMEIILRVLAEFSIYGERRQLALPSSKLLKLVCRHDVVNCGIRMGIKEHLDLYADISINDYVKDNGEINIDTCSTFTQDTTVLVRMANLIKISKEIVNEIAMIKKDCDFLIRSTFNNPDISDDDKCSEDMIETTIESFVSRMKFINPTDIRNLIKHQCGDRDVTLIEFKNILIEYCNYKPVLEGYRKVISDMELTYNNRLEITTNDYVFSMFLKPLLGDIYIVK